MDLSHYVLPQTKITRQGEQPRQILVEKIMAELNIERVSTYKGKQTDNFKRIFFSGVNDKKLEEIWQRARTFKLNPTALFFKLLNEAKREKAIA